MIAYIKGKITYKNRTEIIVEANGIGYFINISLNTYNDIANMKEGTILTHLIVREDAQILYGFATADERSMFEYLISVSGVGANTARLLLSALSAEDIKKAIIAENVAILRAAKGIGPKSAKRIILELKDKLLKDGGSDIDAMLVGATPAGENPVREEALAALLALGFNKAKVQKTLNTLLKANPSQSDSGELIKQALAKLAG